MKPASLARVLSEGYAFDTETHLITDTAPRPKMVCASVAKGAKGDLLDPEKALEWFLVLLDKKTIILANAPFDMGVMIAYAQKQGTNIIPKIFECYRREGIFDVLLAQRLHALAEGNLGFHPLTREPVRYSLDQTTEMTLGRTDAKANDAWRMHYQDLDGIPIEFWPPAARTYPVDDVLNTHEVALHQIAHNKNLHDHQNQVYTDFCLSLGAAHGLMVDPHAIDALEIKTVEDRATRQKRLVKLGYLRETIKKGETILVKNGALVKRKIALAFGCHGDCPACAGGGKVPGQTTHTACRGLGCDDCDLGKVAKLKRHQACSGKGCDDCLGGQVAATLKACPDCSGTGLNLKSAPYPLTATGGVSAGRDALNESGDDELLEYAAYDETAKILSTYIPWLRKGIAPDGTAQAITLRPRVLMETGRIGYGDVVHQLPQDMGVRECIVARPGTALIAADYEGAELIAHAQSCYDIVGWSRMGDALNTGIKVHDQLGARIAGVTYQHMVTNKDKDQTLKNYRQSAKPINFGAQGKLGAPALVMQQRRQGPDTTAPDGTVYKGLRFCILAGGETSCGTKKVTEYKGRLISPMCARCVEVAADFIKAWKETWPENLPYFDHCRTVHQKGTMTQHHTQRVRSGMPYCSVANGYFQGLSGDVIKLAIRMISYETYCMPESPLYGSVLLLPIHDEILAESPLDKVHVAAKRINELMVHAMQELCPKMKEAIRVDVSAMLRWSKHAKAVYNDAGELVPWEG